jgi:hypothetical protein
MVAFIIEAFLYAVKFRSIVKYYKYAFIVVFLLVTFCVAVSAEALDKPVT